jgi:hypothetical protein
MSVKPRILFLTNSQNDEPAEDRLLVQILQPDFDMIVSHPLDCLNLLSRVDGVLIRNIWPTHEYLGGWETIKAALRQSEVPKYNPLGAKGDIEGKDYLTALFKLGYSVIPSVDKVEDLSALPDQGFYWIKPKYSCDGIGAEKIRREHLLSSNLKDYIIQPFFEFQYEPSFFFVDNQFHHAVWTPHRLSDADVKPYMPSGGDLSFAESFVDWADLPYGIQRIDAIRTADGRLLLTEVENLCPYLYLSDLDPDGQRSFLDACRVSLVRVFGRQSTRGLKSEEAEELRPA